MRKSERTSAQERDIETTLRKEATTHQRQKQFKNLKPRREKEAPPQRERERASEETTHTHTHTPEYMEKSPPALFFSLALSLSLAGVVSLSLCFVLLLVFFGGVFFLKCLSNHYQGGREVESARKRERERGPNRPLLFWFLSLSLRGDLSLFAFFFEGKCLLFFCGLLFVCIFSVFLL